MLKIEHSYLKFSDVTLHIAFAGPDDGQLMIFLHGFPENWLAWKKQLLFFGSKGFKAIAFDQRGYNLSSKPKYVHDYRIDLLALDVIKTMRYFKRKRIILVGHDWGANVAWWTSLRYPKIIQKLVIVNVPHPVVMKHSVQTNIRQKFNSWYIYFFQIPIIPELVMSFHKSLLLSCMVTSSANKHAFTKTIISYYRTSWTRSTVHHMIDWYRGMKFGSGKKLSSIKVKPEVLLIWGLRDKFIRKENIIPSLKLCNNSSNCVYPHNTHWIIHENPDKVNNRILTFIHK